MGTGLSDKVYAFTRKNALFSAPCHLLVGVSGGADSMALLDCLSHWPDPDLTLTVVHIHHGLRGASADGDAAFVQNYCNERGIPFILHHVDAAAVALEQRISVETAGRQLRYDLFEKIRCRVGADYIATAHNADDQVETVLMRILRGCGTDGLAGIPVQRGFIRRPFLCCSRAEIEAYCREQHISYVLDESNDDVQYTRNRVRHQILPMLREMNPSVNAALLRLSRHASDDTAYLRHSAMDALQYAKQGDRWRTDAFLSRPQPIRRRMISILLSEASVPTIEEAHIVAVEHLLECGVGETHLPGGILLSVSQGKLRLLRMHPAEVVLREISVDTLPFTARFGDIAFTLSVQKAENVPNIHKLFFNTMIDYDRIQGKLCLRSRQEGDYLHPAGRNIGKSLKKLMNEWQIPAVDRACIPVLCDDLGVVLVPGYACDERVKPTEDTKHFLVWDTHTEQG